MHVHSRNLHNGNGRNGRSRRRRQFRNGKRVAALQAFFAARAFSIGIVGTLKEAAEGCGVSLPYVAAAFTILQTDGATILKEEILAGQISLLAAAREAKPVVAMLKLYREMDSQARTAFFLASGMDTVLDDLATAEACGNASSMPAFLTNGGSSPAMDEKLARWREMQMS